MNYQPFVIGVLVLLLVAFSGCTDIIQTNIGDHTPIVFSGQKEFVTCPTTDYGNGVIFFGCVEGSFARSLSDYIGKNNVTVTSMVPVPAASQYNNIFGYIVTTIPRGG